MALKYKLTISVLLSDGDMGSNGEITRSQVHLINQLIYGHGFRNSVMSINERWYLLTISDTTSESLAYLIFSLLWDGLLSGATLTVTSVQ